MKIKRNQVRQFVSALRALAIQIDCAVLLLSHPSLTGMNTGSGLSGSTAWNNSVRSRLYLTSGGEDDPDARVLSIKKANYGPAGASVGVRWQNGVYVLDGGSDVAVSSLLNLKVDTLFLELLALFAALDQDLSAKPSSTYAPTMMARHPKAKGFTKRQLEAAMQRLLESKRIHIVTEGPPSKQRKRVAVGPSVAARASAMARVTGSAAA
jgi:RecA-family ATPase